MIREASLADLKTIIDMKLSMFEDAKLSYLLHENARDAIESTYRDMHQRHQMKHFVLEVNNEIAAVAGAFLKDEIPYCFYRTPYYGFIGDVYVKREYRRLGYARTLTEAAIHWLTEQNVQMIRLLATPEAEELYRQLGFKHTSEMTLIIEK